MNKTEKIMKWIEKRAKSEFLPIVGPRKGRILAEEIRKTKPKRVLEVGTLIGYSAILMGEQLGKDAYIVTIEIHADEAKQAEDNIGKAGILQRSK